MVLPCTIEGTKLIGPAGGSMLATVEVQGRAQNARQVALKVREESDRAAVLFIEDIAQRSVRRQVFFATLPSGKCLTFERLVAREDITVGNVRQGYLSVMNDGYYAEHDDLRGRRTVYWDGGERTFIGYVTDSDEDDVIVGLNSGWVNIDDRFGLVFRGAGRAFYHNQHRYEVWHATEDALVLSQIDGPKEFKAGERVAELLALWCPDQTRDETSRESLNPRGVPANGIEVEIDGILCTCDFEAMTVALG